MRFVIRWAFALMWHAEATRNISGRKRPQRGDEEVMGLECLSTSLTAALKRRSLRDEIPVHAVRPTAIDRFNDYLQRLFLSFIPFLSRVVPINNRFSHS